LTTDVIVIGGGAAGMLSALTASSGGANVLLLEPNQKLGRKLYITGKGRCNITNDCPVDEVLRNIPCNGKFLYSAISRFPPSEVKAYFTQLGVPLKTERGNRVFPVSDKSADVIDALLRALRHSRVAIMQERAQHLLVRGKSICGVATEFGEHFCKAVILATGGLSYPLTGSTGDGYAMAEELGHTVVKPKPSLVPLVAVGEECAKMQGLSLRNVSIKVKNQKNKVIFEEQGELLFTHFGLSGPLILSASAHMRNFETEKYHVLIDLKPALDEEKLDKRLLREFEENANKEFANALDGLLPRLMIPVIIDRSDIPSETRVNSVTRAQRRALLELLKGFRVDILGPRPIGEAIVTSGGVSIREIEPKTMESRKMKGIYFAGEIMDVDAYTGGFNLQIAWCTGKAAGEAAAQYCKGGGSQ